MAAIRLCLITDRTALADGPQAIDAVVALARDASIAGIDLIQLREKDLSARALFELGCRVVEAAKAGTARVVINDRIDVALAAGAAGVHLSTKSMSADVVRAAVGGDFVVGVSTHSEMDVVAAVAGGVDYVVCGPAYESTPTNRKGAVLGPNAIADIAAASPIPVLALGGIDEISAHAVLRGSDAGVAAIRLFQEAWKTGGFDALAALVDRLRQSV